MKILVFGAGPLGSLLAVRLVQSGQDVTVLARGERLQQIQSDGVVLQDLVSGEVTTSRVEVIETLSPEDEYDWILVTVGKNHIAPILPVLGANRGSQNVLFLGNNAGGPGAYVDALGCERVLMGFLGAAGTLEDGIVKYVADWEGKLARVRIGELNGEVSERLIEIGNAIEEAGFDVLYSEDIDSWLKTHAVFIMGLAGAYVMSGRDLDRLLATRDLQVMMVRAIREGMRVLRVHDVRILPGNLRLLMMLPEPLIVLWIRMWMSSESFTYALIHAEHAGPEMRFLADEIGYLIQTTDIRTPYFDTLRVHMQPSAPKMPPGSDVIRMRWGEVLLPLALIAAAAGAVIGVVTLARRCL